MRWLLIGQKPSIMWIGCADSRVPAEVSLHRHDHCECLAEHTFSQLVTGAAPGDLFVHVRIDQFLLRKRIS